MGHKRIEIELPDTAKKLSMSQLTHDNGYVEHTIGLLHYYENDKGYGLISKPISTNDLQEMFDIVDYAMKGNYNIFMDTIDIEFDDGVQLELIVDNTRDTD